MDRSGERLSWRACLVPSSFCLLIQPEALDITGLSVTQRRIAARGPRTTAPGGLPGSSSFLIMSPPATACGFALDARSPSIGGAFIRLDQPSGSIRVDRAGGGHPANPIDKIVKLSI